MKKSTDSKENSNPTRTSFNRDVDNTETTNRNQVGSKFSKNSSNFEEVGARNSQSDFPLDTNKVIPEDPDQESQQDQENDEQMNLDSPTHPAEGGLKRDLSARRLRDGDLSIPEHSPSKMDLDGQGDQPGVTEI